MTCDERTGLLWVKGPLLVMTLTATGGEKTVLNSCLLLCLQFYQSHTQGLCYYIGQFLNRAVGQYAILPNASSCTLGFFLS